MRLVDGLLRSVSYALEAGVHWLLATVAAVAPYRDEDCWVFGARGGAGFADNSKYLFMYVAEEHPEVRAVWLTRDADVVEDLQSRGYEAYHYWSPRGVWLTLRAGVGVLTHSSRDLNRWLVGGATIAVLWHGAPLKTISWDAELDDLPWPARCGLRYLYGQYDLVTAPGPAAVDPLASGLDLDRDRFVVTGYPRNDALLGAFPESAVADDAVLSGLRRLRERRWVVLYLPTFREEGRRAAENLDVEAMEATLDDLDATLVLKLHPSEELDVDLPDWPADWAAEDGIQQSDGGEAPTVVALPSDVDVYPLLSETDALVTDYSSVFFDYLLVDEPIVFFAYDLEDYRASRDFYFEYEEFTPGPVARSHDDLSESLRAALERDHHRDERAALRERFVSEAEPGARVERAFRAIRGFQRAR